MADNIIFTPPRADSNNKIWYQLYVSLTDKINTELYIPSHRQQDDAGEVIADQLWDDNHAS